MISILLMLYKVQHTIRHNNADIAPEFIFNFAAAVFASESVSAIEKVFGRLLGEFDIKCKMRPVPIEYSLDEQDTLIIGPKGAEDEQLAKKSQDKTPSDDMIVYLDGKPPYFKRIFRMRLSKINRTLVIPAHAYKLTIDGFDPEKLDPHNLLCNLVRHALRPFFSHNANNLYGIFPCLLDKTQPIKLDGLRPSAAQAVQAFAEANGATTSKS